MFIKSQIAFQTAVGNKSLVCFTNGRRRPRHFLSSAGGRGEVEPSEKIGIAKKKKKKQQQTNKQTNKHTKGLGGGGGGYSILQLYGCNLIAIVTADKNVVLDWWFFGSGVWWGMVGGEMVFV